MSALGVQLSFPGAARVMVLGGRKRRDSASVGARVPGVRSPGDKGSGELATGWASSHNRRRWPSEEPWEQPCRAEPSLAGSGSSSRWFPRKGGTGRAAGRPLRRLGRAWQPGQRFGCPVLGGARPGLPPLFVPGAAVRRCGSS